MVEDELEKLDQAGRDAVLQFLNGAASSLESYRDELKDRPVLDQDTLDLWQSDRTGEEQA